MYCRYQLWLYIYKKNACWCITATRTYPHPPPLPWRRQPEISKHICRQIREPYLITQSGLRIRSIFGRIRIQQISKHRIQILLILTKNQFKHQFFHINQIYLKKGKVHLKISKSSIFWIFFLFYTTWQSQSTSRIRIRIRWKISGFERIRILNPAYPRWQT